MERRKQDEAARAQDEADLSSLYAELQEEVALQNELRLER